MSKHFSLIIIVFLITGSLKLQAQNIRLIAPPGYNFIYHEQHFEKGTEGTAYLNKDWKPADILLKNGKTIPDLMVRYNVLENKMVYENKGITYVVGTPDSIAEIKFLDKTFIYKPFEKGNTTENGFFEIVFKGKVSLLRKYEIEILRANYSMQFDTGYKNDRLSLKQELYLQKDNQAAVANKKNKLLEVLSDKNNDVILYIKREKLSVKDHRDLIKILAFYNQL